jgi:hypothetical protein
MVIEDAESEPKPHTAQGMSRYFLSMQKVGLSDRTIIGQLSGLVTKAKEDTNRSAQQSRLQNIHLSVEAPSESRRKPKRRLSWVLNLRYLPLGTYG